MKVLVLFGSMSSEHEISCISAANILENIDTNKYEVEKVGIDKQGNWYIYNGSINNIKNSKWLDDKINLKKINNILYELKKYDVVLPILHGKYGEDGTVQGILEFAKVKYVGCDVLASSIAMNKSFTKRLVAKENIPIVDYFYLSKKDYINFSKKDLDNYINTITEKLSLPVFVKPNREGSSYGAKKANNILELKENIKYAFYYDDNILIEKYIDNRKEIECAVLQDKDKLIISTPGEILSANEIYDFNSKYIDKNSTYKIPAEISQKLLNKIKEYSKNIFNLLNLRDLARIDFFVSNNKIYFNEINTMPGFTQISMFPKMLEYDNITYKEIIDILIRNT